MSSSVQQTSKHFHNSSSNTSFSSHTYQGACLTIMLCHADSLLPKDFTWAINPNTSFNIVTPWLSRGALINLRRKCYFYQKLMSMGSGLPSVRCATTLTYSGICPPMHSIGPFTVSHRLQPPTLGWRTFKHP